MLEKRVDALQQAAQLCRQVDGQPQQCTDYGARELNASRVLEALAGRADPRVLVATGQLVREALSHPPRGDVDRLEWVAFLLQHGSTWLKRQPLASLAAAFAMGLEHRWWAAQVRAGDTSARQALWASLWQALMPVIERSTRSQAADGDVASDVLNEAIQIVLKRIEAGRFEPEPLNSPDPILAFVRETAHLCLNNCLRRQRRRQHLVENSLPDKLNLDEQATPPLDEEVELDPPEERDAALMALDILCAQPRREKGALLLKMHLCHALTVPELATARGMSEDAVRKGLERAQLWVCETWMTTPRCHGALKALGRGNLLRGAIRVMVRLFRGRLRACSTSIVRRLTQALELSAEEHTSLVRLMVAWWACEQLMVRWRSRHGEQLAVLVRTFPKNQRLALEILLGLPCNSDARQRRTFRNPNDLHDDVWNAPTSFQRILLQACEKLGRLLFCLRERSASAHAPPGNGMSEQRSKEGGLGSFVLGHGLPPPQGLFGPRGAGGAFLRKFRRAV
ncbi:MAG: ECF-type sigma factor [Myxococcota bacterium]